MKPSIVHHGDCRDIMRAMETDSIDSCVTDPPYSIGFMGKNWDGQIAFDPALWREVLRVLRPGAHLIAFAAERTYHRLACAIEDAGFEIRHMGVWVSAQSFPKSLDVSKAIDKAAGAEREVVGINLDYLRRKPNRMKTSGASVYGYSVTQQETDARITAPATPDAAKWSGWGTALKTCEPYVLARKPLGERTVAANVLRYGTGALNIDGCMLPFAGAENTNGGAYSTGGRSAPMAGDIRSGSSLGMYEPGRRASSNFVQPQGRWPSTVMVADLDVDGPVGGVEVLGEQEALGIGGVLGPYTRHFRVPGTDGAHDEALVDVPDALLGAVLPTMVVCPKASTSEREEGLREEDFELRDGNKWNQGGIGERRRAAGLGFLRNVHPTVKPIALMRRLVRLVTPRGGIVLDPFAGSGSTGVAAVWEGAGFVGCEMNDTEAEPYARIARARIAYAEQTPPPELKSRQPTKEEEKEEKQGSLF